jgi:hypothetical protein
MEPISPVMHFLKPPDKLIQVAAQIQEHQRSQVLVQFVEALVKTSRKAREAAANHSPGPVTGQKRKANDTTTDISIRKKKK